MDDSDSELWRRFAKDVRPLRRRSPPAPATAAGTDIPAVTPPLPRPAITLAPPPSLRPPPPSPVGVLAPGVAPGLDQRTLQRLKRGLIPPEAEIDLHYHTQDEAHAALYRFLVAGQAAGRRCVLVITGKGYGSKDSTGVLKAAVPRWLNEPGLRARVLALTHATTAFGGDGALFVLLRRKRV